MSGQKMGANTLQAVAAEECWPHQKKARTITQTRQTIRKIRERLGFNQEEFAQWLALSVRMVARWEAGDDKPTRMARKLIFDMFREEIRAREV